MLAFRRLVCLLDLGRRSRRSEQTRRPKPTTSRGCLALEHKMSWKLDGSAEPRAFLFRSSGDRRREPDRRGSGPVARGEPHSAGNTEPRCSPEVASPPEGRAVEPRVAAGASHEPPPPVTRRGRVATLGRCLAHTRCRRRRRADSPHRSRRPSPPRAPAPLRAAIVRPPTRRRPSSLRPIDTGDRVIVALSPAPEGVEPPGDHPHRREQDESRVPR